MNQHPSISFVRRAWPLGLAGLFLMAPDAALKAALPQPLVELRFSESGDAAANSGSLGGSATLVQADEYPAVASNVPAGPYAPSGNSSALDFGDIAAGEGGRAVDLYPLAGDGTLGALNAFTVCGWLNCRDLNEGWGGNRIAFALAEPNGPGFDLVQLANGALRIGINQWPDGGNGGGPQSSAGLVTPDPQAGAGNWVFFAVTYDAASATQNLRYYFGDTTRLASLDSAHNYTGGVDNGGAVEFTGTLTLGNFSEVVGARNETGPNGGSRVFRGLMDEVRIYDVALTQAEVQQAQLNGELPPEPVAISGPPLSQTVFAGQTVTFRVQATGSAPLSFQWQRNSEDIPGATEVVYTLPQVSTGDHGAVFRVKVSNAASPDGVFSDPATLSVVEETGHKVSLSFSESGTVTNRGNLGGSGVYVVTDDYPQLSGNIPTGPFAPADNLAAVDFGSIADGQGGRAVDLQTAITPTLGPMAAFTVTGWLNCRDLTEGWGGNRIAFALASPNGPGFDLVQTAAGALRLGVNQWPDAGAGGPISSPDKITANPDTNPGNWVFFAVTYDSTVEFGQVAYYFGTPDQAAEADVVADYLQGAIEESGALSIGNFGAVAGARNEVGPNGGSRVFRGLLDELNVFNRALSLVEIQAVQKAPAYQPEVLDPPVIAAAEPVDQTTFAGTAVIFRVTADGTPPLQYQWWKSHAGVESAITGATGATYTLETALADHGDQFWVVVSNQVSAVASRKAILTVLPENHHKVALSFSEGSGATTANLGNLGGTADLVQANDFPRFTSSTPAGPFAPSGNTSAVDFGGIADGEGGRALDLHTAITPALGPMTAFTITGWLNCRDLTEGWGGNRIAFALASPNGPGFDLVQLADGGMRLGVNQWPDAGVGGPLSSAGRINADSDTGPANWVFFAVTYDSTVEFGQVTYYFGTPDQAAGADTVADYDRGAIEQSGALTIGNFGSVVGARNEVGPNGGSRVFRGLLDELNVFNRALSLEEIQAVQQAPPFVPDEAPVLAVSLQQEELILTWSSTATFQLQARTHLDPGEIWANETTAPTVDGNQKTVRLPADGSTRFFRLASQ
ncbi:MAG: hypothetical protein KIT22_07165 [Verrucomicrobiae bacterium]|nr:hypothetical protein [Verrucomicrobiae bacterium]